MSTPAETAPKPCPHCGVQPVLRREAGRQPAWYAACANELDCPVWPMTFLHATPAEAITAWNAGDTH